MMKTIFYLILTFAIFINKNSLQFNVNNSFTDSNEISNQNSSILTNKKNESYINFNNSSENDGVLLKEKKMPILNVQKMKTEKKLKKNQQFNTENYEVTSQITLNNCQKKNKTKNLDIKVTTTIKNNLSNSFNILNVTKMEQQIRLKSNNTLKNSRKLILNQEEKKKNSVGMKTNKHNYKLIYFDARGICEPIRLLFHYSKTPFEDSRITRRQWLGIKDSTIYGKVPILEVDGKPLTYCHTISRYLARTFGLAGINSWEQAKVDEISDFHSDVANDLQPYLYVVAGFHQGDRNALRKIIFLPNVEKHFPIYVNLLKQSKSGFFVNSGLTWIDFVISEYMTTIKHFEPAILDKYPSIVRFIKKVQALPQIFEYIANREHQPVL